MAKEEKARKKRCRVGVSGCIGSKKELWRLRIYPLKMKAKK